ncbi:hypothetical protein [Nitrososphaeria virus YSH_462411]|uniref:Uncharacterized protein n=1 Tax=Nitrososphaeria virus YSH_462411 TaxID=3071321 RepID=A0A976UBE2_9CAUD|nr:hypothetical protein QKV92_gp14 [Yangshan Harbor Nitrososphaeria virus]UVF62286.1 hypothetical protein [Nitrososphaeria virus YSH_462411]
MAITASDLEFYLSGGAGNTDPNASLGGVISTTAIINSSDNNLFDDVTGDEADSGDTEYRGIYFKNNHGSLTLQNAVVWFSSNTTSADDTLNMALAGEGVNATMETIVNESTAPSGESFSAPASKGAGLSFGNITAGQRYGLWIQRVVNASAAAANANAATISVEGDTAA